MYRIAILDDIDNAIKNLKDYILNILKENECKISEYNNPTKFLNEFNGHYDLIFLDIAMPGLNGIEVAKKIREFDNEVMIVFLTSIEKYAIKGYEVNAFDYILKPYQFSDFKIRFERILNRLDIKKKVSNRFTIKTKSGYKIIDKHDVVYVESDGHYVLFHTLNEVYKERMTFKEVADEFDNENFSSCNKGYIINLNFVKNVDDIFVSLTNGEKIQIARLKKKAFLDALNNFYLKG